VVLCNAKYPDPINYLYFPCRNVSIDQSQYHILTEVNDGCHKWSGNCFTFHGTWVQPRRFVDFFFFLSFCHFFFDHCIICPSNYGFWLPLCYFPIVLVVGGFALVTKITEILFIWRETTINQSICKRCYSCIMIGWSNISEKINAQTFLQLFSV